MSKVKQGTIAVRLLNFRNFNPRKDVKASSWFRLDHGLLDDPQFLDFSHAEMVAFLYILCLASKKYSDDVVVYLEHAERIRRLKPNEVRSAIEKLAELQILQILPAHVTSTAAPGTHTGPTDRQTDRQTSTDSEEASEERRPTESEIEAAYKQYPRKEGKTRGMAILRKEIRTPEDLSLLLEAISNYSRSKTVANGFVKLFSTFAGEWRDWADPETGGVAAAHVALHSDLKRSSDGGPDAAA